MFWRRGSREQTSMFLHAVNCQVCWAVQFPRKQASRAIYRRVRIIISRRARDADCIWIPSGSDEVKVRRLCEDLQDCRANTGKIHVGTLAALVNESGRVSRLAANAPDFRMIRLSRPTDSSRQTRESPCGCFAGIESPTGVSGFVESVRGQDRTGQDTQYRESTRLLLLVALKNFFPQVTSHFTHVCSWCEDLDLGSETHTHTPTHTPIHTL
ncbi:uncharacterized protein LOC133508782 isoform X1 [Syngnathoides biaculeatus]|uniref:uncharacterized protein LOC133508782 isoform X1 n=1 Tax=Syngnathoides biaculeatus TaxID=300417 RepID=UPI002ADE4934|nr:uncharacterized protein LOC133508782 isoform X1 [Syngnathoides biaculeatus]